MNFQVLIEKNMHGCKRIEKTHSLHSVMSTDKCNWTLKTREYSCFRDSCIDEDYQECINQTRGYTSAWISIPPDVPIHLIKMIIFLMIFH